MTAQAPAAHIRIDTNRVIGEVHPHIFGNFAEHLGRCIYGGIFEEGSPLSDADGYRKDVLEAVKPLGVSILRWPGGNFASGYNWTDGIGPRDQRPARPDHAWGALESNRFGTDEFLRYCERIGAEPYLCINAGLGSVDQARQWVEYCNETRPTYWAKQRAKNGREKPWNVKVWGLGNEIDGPWQLGHKNAEDYARFALVAAVAMRREDDSIKLIASGSSNFGANADWVGWNRTVLDTLKDEIDYISLHTYIGNPDSNFEKFLAVSQDLDDRIAIVEGQIKAARNSQTRPHPIYIAFDEWNTWYRARSGTTEFEIAKTGLEEHYNFEDALATGMFLNSFFRHANIVKMANLAQLVNVIAPIFTNKQGLYLQTIYFPLLEYGKQRGNSSLDVQVTGPTYRIGNRQPLGYLDVSSTYNAAEHAVYLNVLNRSEKTDISAGIDNVAGQIAGQAAVWEMNHPDLKATNDFGSEKARPTTRTVTLALANNGFTYAFPKHSLTILRLELSATPAVSPGKLAARPLYRDPPFDNPTDPVFTYNAETKKWFMYYTQRRGAGIALIHGTKIGIATSEDNGATWKYLGTAGITYGQDQHPADYTYWAPEVIWVADKYHMYLSYVPGIFTDWNHPREIVHLTSKDGIKWDTVGKVDLKSGKVIDACVIQLPDGNWRMFYKDEEKPMALSYADSPDLYKWETKGNAVTDRNGEGPKCIHWQGKYWLIADTWSGQGVWSSDDCTHWKAQDGVLIGNHGDVVINGDRAWWFYFGGQYGRNANINWAVIPTAIQPGDTPGASTAPATATVPGRGGRGGAAINVVELKVMDGKLMYTNPNQPVYIDLGNQRELEK